MRSAEPWFYCMFFTAYEAKAGLFLLSVTYGGTKLIVYTYPINLACQVDLLKNVSVIQYFIYCEYVNKYSPLSGDMAEIANSISLK